MQRLSVQHSCLVCGKNAYSNINKIGEQAVNAISEVELIEFSF